MLQYLFEPDVLEMLVNFHSATGLRIGIHDTDMNILMEYPVKPEEYGLLRFCDKVRFHSPDFADKCRQCDLCALEHIRVTKKTYVYKCHSGFSEALIPVMAGDDIAYALMIGQVRGDKLSPGTYQKIIRHIKPGLLNEAETADILSSYNSMPEIEDAKFEAFVYFLEMCAQKLYDNRWVRYEEMSIIENFTAFVEKNIYNSIDIKQTASALFVSVSHLSRLISLKLGTTFTQYLNARRIEIAKDLLLLTDMNIKDISAYLRFNEHTYFMKVFKKLTGSTCSDYSRRGRESSRK